MNIGPSVRTNALFVSILLSCTFGVAACADAGGPSEGLAGPGALVEPGIESAAAGAESQDADIALAWFRLSFDLTRDEGLAPPRAARAYAYASVTLWEAVAPGVPGGTSLAGRLNGLADVPAPSHALHWPSVANTALADIMRRFYTSSASRRAIGELERSFARRFRDEIPGALLGRSVAHGQQIASAIRQWSRGDGYEIYHDCAYTPPVGADQWSPTSPGFDAPVEPCWGKLRPFVLSGPEACPAGPHPVYSEDVSSEFYQQALEVYETVNDLTEEQRTIAFYWADLAGESPTPAGHSLSMAAQALEQIDAPLALAGETFARVGIGESDAFISAWATKYHYNLLRPITYINERIDPDWQAVLDTPPFPAYTSGHSNDVGAASTILTALFGDGFAITDHTNEDRGFAPRSFGSFAEAADESAISRLYGGIHYRFDIEQGLEQGRCVGRVVNALELRTTALAGG